MKLAIFLVFEAAMVAIIRLSFGKFVHHLYSAIDYWGANQSALNSEVCWLFLWFYILAFELMAALLVAFEVFDRILRWFENNRTHRRMR